MAMVRVWRLVDDTDVDLCSGPMFHAAGMGALGGVPFCRLNRLVVTYHLCPRRKGCGAQDRVRWTASAQRPSPCRRCSDAWRASRDGRRDRLPRRRGHGGVLATP
ncbi:hypothetical protein CA951_21425 [Rhodococcus sp. NCIMB 12038]|nr:hypothetical protein CA951_21425 [Rhodococcus sp. NCIMB 12038]